MGDEFGQWNEWDFRRSLDWHLLQDEPHSALQSCVRDLNRMLKALPQLHAIDFHHSGFEWIDFADADQSIICFMRKGKDPKDPVIVAGNLTPVPRLGYRMGVPFPGTYRVIFNSDSSGYGGSNVGDGLRVTAEDPAWQGRPYSVKLDLPPLGVIYLRWEPGG